VEASDVLLRINLVIVAWIAIRSAVGLVRIWPGVGASRLRA